MLRVALAGPLGLALLAGCSVLGGLDDLKGGAGGHGATNPGGFGGNGANAGDGGSTCPPGKKACGASCVDVSDPSTGCGEPGCAPCALPHASPICVGGACVASQCELGYQDCNANPGDGCEAALQTDSNNCGACLTSCAVPHSSVSCQGGACKFGACDAGYADCNADGKDGCEANTSSDPNHCGSCSSICPAPSGKSAVCNAGQCGISNCASPLEDCDKDPSGSCETDLSSSLADCGFCGNACSFANAAASCANGVCKLAACNAGYTDCDGNAANGCETNTGASLQNCGSCGKVCTSATHGQAACSNGSCSLVCSPGYGNCNGDLTDGCETALNTSANCGACAKVLSVSGSANSGSSFASVTASGSTLTFGWCNTSNGSCGYSSDITLNGFTASGSVSGNNITQVMAQGNALVFNYCTTTYCGLSGQITLVGATASGSTSGDQLQSLTASGNVLSFQSCYTGSQSCGFGGDITITCSP